VAKKYIDDLKQESQVLAQLLRDREEIEVKIARQRKRITALVELCDESEFGRPFDFDLGGLTDVCRTAMRASRKEWMTIAEIQAAVKALGFPLDKYKAPAASITTTVNRLATAEEVVVDKRSAAGASEYKYVGTAAASGKAMRELAEILQKISEATARMATEKKG
jgi:hypothetical protein